MNCLIITFPNHKVYIYLKLIVDNFPNSGRYKFYPNGMKNSAASWRARCVSCRYKIHEKVRETLGSLGVWDWHLSWRFRGPGWCVIRDAQKVEVFWGVWEFELDRRKVPRRAPGAPGPRPSDQEDLTIGSLGVWGVWQNRGPWDFPHITRALETRSFRRGPWFYSRETIWLCHWQAS